MMNALFKELQLGGGSHKAAIAVPPAPTFAAVAARRDSTSHHQGKDNL